MAVLVMAHADVSLGQQYLYISIQCRNLICTVVPASGRAEYINVCCVYLDVVNRLWIVPISE